MGLFKNSYTYALTASAPADPGVRFDWLNDYPYKLYDTSEWQHAYLSLAVSAFSRAGIGLLDLSLINIDDTPLNNGVCRQYYMPILVNGAMDGMFQVKIVATVSGLFNKTDTQRLEVAGFDVSKKSPNTEEMFDKGFANLRDALESSGFK